MTTKAKVIQKSNCLITNTNYVVIKDLPSLLEQKIIAYAAAQVQEEDVFYDKYNDLKYYKIKLSEIGVTGGRDLKSLKKTLDHLKMTGIMVNALNPKEPPRMINYCLGYSMYYEGIVGIAFSQQIINFYKPKNNYTKILLPWILDFSSKYSAPIFEMLLVCSYSGMNQIISISTEKLKNILNTKYQNFELPQKVIVPAVKDIEKVIGLKIKVDLKKGKRSKLEGFIFTLENLNSLTKVTESQKKELQKKYTKDEIEKAILYTQTRKNINFFAYLKATLENGWAH